VINRKGIVDLEIEPGFYFFERFPSRFPLQTIGNGRFEVACCFGRKGDHLLNHLNVVADSLRLRFKQRKAEIDSGLRILGIEFHGEPSRPQGIFRLVAKQLQPRQTGPPC